jgi:lipopolysaccharide/colanic/teichoic acid biosynthesis glycosyltransferase
MRDRARSSCSSSHLNSHRVYGKRLFDIMVALSALAVLSPVMLLIGLLVRVSSPGPAIYRGTRVGRGGREFQIYKFRTMRHEPLSQVTQLTTSLGDPRITPLGRWLRRYKVDELPQLLNVVRGDMSIVGPRPEFAQWVELYEPDEFATILSVRPGLTDFASLRFIDLDKVVGPSNADEEYLRKTFIEKNRLRIRYVDEMSWRTDLRLIGRTALGVVRRR